MKSLLNNSYNLHHSLHFDITKPLLVVALIAGFLFGSYYIHQSYVIIQTQLQPVIRQNYDGILKFYNSEGDR